MADAGRVIAGIARATRLEAPGAGTRPLGDRVKQSLFGALEADGVVGPGTAFLDLFAGSGAAGIEALSRGALRAVMVDQEPGATEAIGRNLARTRLSGGQVVRADVLHFLAGEPPATPFDAVLLDPPYESALLEPAMTRLADPARAWLTRAAVVVAKHFWRSPPAEVFGSLRFYRRGRYGETMLTFYRQEER